MPRARRAYSSRQARPQRLDPHRPRPILPPQAHAAAVPALAGRPHAEPRPDAADAPAVAQLDLLPPPGPHGARGAQGKPLCAGRCADLGARADGRAVHPGLGGDEAPRAALAAQPGEALQPDVGALGGQPPGAPALTLDDDLDARPRMEVEPDEAGLASVGAQRDGVVGRRGRRGSREYGCQAGGERPPPHRTRTVGPATRPARTRYAPARPMSIR